VRPSVRGRDSPGDVFLTCLIVALIVGTPTVFFRKVFFTFQIPQLTFFWMATTAILLVGVYRVAIVGVLDRAPRPLTVGSGCFVLALVLSTVMSPQPWAAFSGLTARGAGAFSYLLCIGLLHTVYGLVRRRSAEPLVWAMIAANLVVATYALLQAFGADLIDWAGDDLYVGNLVFSTLGNANFSAGFVGLTMPLLVWLPFGSRHPASWRIAGGASVGIAELALVYLNSFQGNVAAGASVAVLAMWAVQRDRSERLVAILIVAPVAATVAASALVSHTSGQLMLLPFLAVPVASAYAAIRWDERGPSSRVRAEPVAARGLWIGAGSLALAVGTLAALFGGRLLDEASSGMEQRIEYWRASLSIFRSNPVVGTGLETYQSYFTAHRSAEWAVEWEMLLSNTPHSVPLSILGGGGVLLMLGYLAVLGVVGYFGFRAVKRSEGPARLFYGAVLAAWAAYQVQASVSTDQPGLITVQWVLGGVLVAAGAPEASGTRSLPWKAVRGRTGGRRGRVSGRRPTVVAVLLVAVYALCLAPLTAPFRANAAVYRGQQALNAGDLEEAEAEFQLAADLQPRHGFYPERLADLYELRGENDAALDERQRIARLDPGDPYAAVRAARAAIRVGDLNLAGFWYEQAILNDPFGATVLTEAADFHAKTGRGVRALELLENFEALRSTNLTAWQVAGAVYAFLANEEEAKHAAACAEPGQIGCW
jgi:hypothetical protein